MSILSLLGMFLVTLMFMLFIRVNLRMHLRTGMMSTICFAVSGVIFIIVLWIAYICESDFCMLLFLALALMAFILHFMGIGLLGTRESGLWKEIYETTSGWQRLTGNIPFSKFEKPPPPAMSRRTGLILGITAITFGSLLIIVNISFKIQEFFIHFFITAILALIIGLMLVIFSIIYLDKSKKSPE